MDRRSVGSQEKIWPLRGRKARKLVHCLVKCRAFQLINVWAASHSTVSIAVAANRRDVFSVALR